MKSDLRMLTKFIYKLGDSIITFIEFVVILATTSMALFATYYIIRDMGMLHLESSLSELQILVNDVFMLIIFAEIIRSVLVSHRRPEAYVVGIAEVGFVVSVREIFVSILTRSTYDVVLAAGATLIMALVLWIVRTKVLKS